MLAIELSITAILAFGMLLVLLPGLIDLSVGSGVGLIGGIAAVLVTHHHWSAEAAMAAGIVLAIGLWPLMGTLIVKLQVPAFIITLGGLLIFKGLFWKVIQNSTVPIVPGNAVNLYSLLTTYYLPAVWGYGLVAFSALFALWRAYAHRRADKTAKVERTAAVKELGFYKVFLGLQGLLLLVIIFNQFRGVPLSLVILGGVGLLVHVLTKHTPFGRYLYAIGSNESAAALSGVPVHKVIIAAYGILGVIVALTGYLQTAYAGASTTTVGDLLELDAIAACVMGGTSLKGGRGTVVGVLFGALIMTSLLNGMTLLAVSPEIKFITRGAVLVAAVALDKAGSSGRA
jgi:D-xylose transport system permease protein